MGISDALRAMISRLAGADRESSRSPAKPALATPRADEAGRALLAGRSALIVGAGMNVGLGIALELAREGAALCITNSAQPDLDAVAAALRTAGTEPCTVRSDVTAPGSGDAVLARLDEHRMLPDILVLNVGVHAAQGEPDLDEMDRVFRTNVTAPLHLARRIAARMRSSGRGGSILFVSSIHGASLFGDALYSGSKAAVGMIVRELAAEFASARVRVNAIAPGWVAAGADGAPLPHRLTPLYRMSIPPSFVGKAAVFLAADSLSGHTTGIVLTVDGGASLLNSIVSPAYLLERDR